MKPSTIVFLFLGVAVLVLLSSCPAKSPKAYSKNQRSWLLTKTFAAETRVTIRRAKLIAMARTFLGENWIPCPLLYGTLRRLDCSTLLRCLYLGQGIDLYLAPPAGRRGNGVRILYAYVRAFGRLHRSKHPIVGDIAFFHYTKNRFATGGLWSHVAVVEKVEPTGRILLIHHPGKRKGRIHRIYMHLSQPNVHKIKTPQGWLILNSYLVSPRRRKLGQGAMTGELLAAFGTVLL